MAGDGAKAGSIGVLFSLLWLRDGAGLDRFITFTRETHRFFQKVTYGRQVNMNDQGPTGLLFWTLACLQSKKVPLDTKPLGRRVAIRDLP